MFTKAIPPLLAAILLVACDSTATGAPVATAPDATADTQPEPATAQTRPHSSGSEATGAATTTNANERVLRDSYYECAASNDGSTWAMQACVAAEFEYQDARLNAAYRNVMAKLSDHKRSELKDEEKKWISERDSVCSWDAQVEGQAQRIEANICALKRTAERATQLERTLLD
jgi:uncharacterized protein YecT (DUF1311 family)